MQLKVEIYFTSPQPQIFDICGWVIYIWLNFITVSQVNTRCKQRLVLKKLRVIVNYCYINANKKSDKIVYGVKTLSLMQCCAKHITGTDDITTIFYIVTKTSQYNYSRMWWVSNVLLYHWLSPFLESKTSRLGIKSKNFPPEMFHLSFFPRLNASALLPLY